MIIGIIVRAARSGYQPGPPPARRKRNYTPAQARLRFACCLAVTIFVTVMMIWGKYTP